MADVTDTDSPECEILRWNHALRRWHLPPMFPRRRTRIGRRSFARNICQHSRGGGDAGQTVATRPVEILEEIGRGGMGVIYRARQRHSRRIVAVKRIMTHDIGSNETLIRFRREAEAAARLDHPNIIPIYEVSESEDGLPFFSMKYATGGSLRAALSALREKPRECVQSDRQDCTCHGLRTWPGDIAPRPSTGKYPPGWER